MPDILSKMRAVAERQRVEQCNPARLELHHCETGAVLHTLASSEVAGADLSGLKLAGVNLRYRDLTKTDLSGADLTAALLTGATLVETKLRGACLRGAKLANTQLIEADLTEADMRGADLTLSLLRAVRLEGTNLKNVRVNKTRFADLSLHGRRFASKFSNSWVQVSLSHVNLNGCDFSEMNLIGARIYACNLEGVRLTDARLASVIFGDCDLTGVDFTKVTFRWTWFHRCRNLHKAIGLDQVDSRSELTLDAETLQESVHALPDSFLQLAGLRSEQIPSLRALYPRRKGAG